jgi:hypothetical protein
MGKGGLMSAQALDYRHLDAYALRDRQCLEKDE